MSVVATDVRAAITRDDIVMLARGWIGTPYHHQASLRGVGTDCLGLLRGVWREAYGTEAERPSAYTRDWAEVGGREDLLAGAERNLVRASAMAPGDVVLFRMRPGSPAKHVGLLTTTDTFIHAAEGTCVSEVALGGWWRRHIAAVYAFPGVEAQWRH